jgi:hypothetical protein
MKMDGHIRIPTGYREPEMESQSHSGYCYFEKIIILMPLS